MVDGIVHNDAIGEKGTISHPRREFSSTPATRQHDVDKPATHAGHETAQQSRGLMNRRGVEGAIHLAVRTRELTRIRERNAPLELRNRELYEHRAIVQRPYGTFVPLGDRDEMNVPWGMAPSISNTHVPVVSCLTEANWDPVARAGALRSVNDHDFVRAAGHARRLLPSIVHDSLIDFSDAGDSSGALLLRGLPVGEVPVTPCSRRAVVKHDAITEFMLLSVARCLGQPVGYLPEHDGALVQNLFPMASTASLQVSTSSEVDLFFHTETAFHPYRPRYLLLLCLRGDSAARTTLCSFDAVSEDFDSDELAILREPRFRTGVDASFGGSPNDLGDTIAVLSGSRDNPTFVFDADLMIGVDREADHLLQKLRARITENATSIVLQAGDLLVIDNFRAVHGRSPFRARFDGTDRWLQRAFVVSDLAPSACDREGRIITTRWASAERITP